MARPDDPALPDDEHAGSTRQGVGRRELRALAVAVALLLVAEAGLRLGSTRLTADAQHIADMPALLVGLDADESPPDVLFVGNSITRRGIDLEVFADDLAVNAVALHPDDTTIAEWPFLYDHFVASDGYRPDVVVVPFVQGQLRDDRPLNPDRIGRDYTAVADLFDRWREVDTFSERVDLTGSYASSVYGNRERVSRRFFDLVPGYRDLARDINDLGVGDRDTSDDQQAGTYERLRGLRDAVVAGGGRLVVVAMPTMADYDIEPELVAALDELGVALVDQRDADGLTPELFRDNLHLDDNGAALVTAAIRLDLADAGVLTP